MQNLGKFMLKFPSADCELLCLLLSRHHTGCILSKHCVNTTDHVLISCGMLSLWLLVCIHVSLTCIHTRSHNDNIVRSNLLQHCNNTTDQNLSKIFWSVVEFNPCAFLQGATMHVSTALIYNTNETWSLSFVKSICYKEFYVSTFGNNLCMAARMMVAESNWKVVQSNAEQTLQLFKYETMQVTQNIAKLNLNLVCPCVNSNKQQSTQHKQSWRCSHNKAQLVRANPSPYTSLLWCSFSSHCCSTMQVLQYYRDAPP